MQLRECVMQRDAKKMRRSGCVQILSRIQQGKRNLVGPLKELAQMRIGSALGSGKRRCRIFLIRASHATTSSTSAAVNDMDEIRMYSFSVGSAKCLYFTPFGTDLQTHIHNWRRGRDSNPRYGVTVRLISSQVHSTTLPPLRLLPHNTLPDVARHREGAHFTSNIGISGRMLGGSYR